MGTQPSHIPAADQCGTHHPAKEATTMNNTDAEHLGLIDLTRPGRNLDARSWLVWTIMVALAKAMKKLHYSPYHEYFKRPQRQRRYHTLKALLDLVEGMDPADPRLVKVRGLADADRTRGLAARTLGPLHKLALGCPVDDLDLWLTWWIDRASYEEDLNWIYE